MEQDQPTPFDDITEPNHAVERPAIWPARWQAASPDQPTRPLRRAVHARTGPRGALLVMMGMVIGAALVLSAALLGVWYLSAHPDVSSATPPGQPSDQPAIRPVATHMHTPTPSPTAPANSYSVALPQATATPSPSPNPTATSTATPTPTAEPTVAPTATPAATPTPTAPPAPSPTSVPTAAPSPSSGSDAGSP